MIKTRMTSIFLVMLLITMPQSLSTTPSATPTENTKQTPKEYYEIWQRKTGVGNFMDSLEDLGYEKRDHSDNSVDSFIKASRLDGISLILLIHSQILRPLKSLCDALKSTKKQMQQDSIIKDKNGTGFQIITQHDDTGDHIFISVDDETINQIRSSDDEEIVNFINKKWSNYQEKQFAAFQPKALNIIKELAPELHAKITALDEDGSQHIEFGDDSIGVSSTTHDGLPKIILDYAFIQLSPDIQRAIIAHELGHYALEHGIETILQKVKKRNNYNGIDALNPDTKINTETPLTSNKKLEPSTSLKNAHSRTIEYEADRFAMVNLGISYDDAQAMIKTFPDDHECITFEKTHPFDTDRLKQFQAIASEIELVKNSPSIKNSAIDWDKIQYDTLQCYSFIKNNNTHGFLTHFKDAVEKYMPHRLPDTEKYIQENEAYLKEKSAKKDLQPLSTKEWVNIHKFLLPIDSPMIEKLQSCEAAGGSCIKKGEDGTGVQIIPDNDNPDKFMISFDSQTINQINSNDPTVKTELNKNMQDIFTKHLADKANFMSQTKKTRRMKATDTSWPTKKSTRKSIPIQPQEEPKLTIDKPIYTSPFMIKTKIASPYNKMGDLIKTLPPKSSVQEIPNAIRMNQQYQHQQELGLHHQSEHLVAIE